MLTAKDLMSSNVIAVSLDTPVRELARIPYRGYQMLLRLMHDVAEGTPLLPLAANIVRFFRNESCGKCVPCRVGSTKAVALLERIPNPSDDDIDGAMSGNICRCGTYTRIREAIQRAAEDQS